MPKYVPAGRNERGMRVTPTSISIFDSYDIKTFQISIISLFWFNTTELEPNRTMANTNEQKTTTTNNLWFLDLVCYLASS